MQEENDEQYSEEYSDSDSELEQEEDEYTVEHLELLTSQFETLLEELDSWISDSRNLQTSVETISSQLQTPTLTQTLDSYIRVWKQEQRFQNNGLEISLTPQEQDLFQIYTKTASIYCIAQNVCKKS